jgi:hypothetical protein
MTLRSRADIRAETEQWRYYAGRAGPVPVSGTGSERRLRPREATEWGGEVLSGYARDNPQADVTAGQIRTVASGFASTRGREWGQLDPHTRQLSAVLVNSASTQLAEQELGVSPELAELAIENLADGRVTEQEVESMCGMAGAMGGAVIGQAFGIPAPIGAFVGGLAGELVGGIVSGIFGLGDGAAARELDRARAQATIDQWNGWLRGVRSGCEDNAELYKSRLNFAVTDLGQKLDRVQRDLGQRLNLVWSGTIGSTDYGGSYLDQIARLGSTTHQTSGGRIQSATCMSPYGCAFPSVIAPSGELTPTEQQVANALAFYGAEWRGPSYQERYGWFCTDWPTMNMDRVIYQQRTAGSARTCNVYGTSIPPLGRPVIGEVCDFYKAAYRESMEPGAALRKLVPAQLLTRQAIVRAAAITQARREVSTRHIALAQQGAEERVSAWKVGRERTQRTNNGMLIAGALLFGYALYRAKQEGRL